VIGPARLAFLRRTRIARSCIVPDNVVRVSASPGTLRPTGVFQNSNGLFKMNTLETSTLAKVTKRLVPFLIICYFVAYLDRVNVGFAALTMNQDLGLSQTAFGFGAGIFFIAYFIFEVPSNLLLERFGARKWIARIMLSWGILSGLMAFIPDIAAAPGSATRTASI
jgi:sugar phosphate permease